MASRAHIGFMGYNGIPMFMQRAQNCSYPLRCSNRARERVDGAELRHALYDALKHAMLA